MIRCQKCNTLNLDFQLNCTNCKAKLWHTCSACGAVVPMGAKFCGSCGRVQPERLQQEPEELKLSVPKFLPKGDFKARQTLLDSFPPLLEKALNGEGQVVFLSGDAGVGKSTLIANLLQYAKDNGFRTFHIRSTPITRSIVLFPLLSLVSQVCDLQDNDDRNRILPKVMKLTALGLTNEETAVIGEYFGLELQSKIRSGWSSEAHHLSAVFYAIVRLIRNLSLKHPTVVAFDDTQWLDPISKRFFQPLIEVVAGMRLLLVIGTRDKDPIVSPHDHVHVIEAETIEARDLMRLVANCFGVDALPPDVAQSVFLAAEGNPTLALEVAEYMKDAELVRIEKDGVKLVRSAQLPNTIESVVKARLEFLSAPQRELLMLITLLACDATEDNLRALYRYKQYLASDLEVLERKGFIVKVEQNPPRYQIRHTATYYVLDYLIPLEVRQNVQPLIARTLLERGCRIRWMRDWVITFHMSLLPPRAFEAHYALERLSRQMFDCHQYGLSLIALQSVSQILKARLQSIDANSEEAEVINQKLAYTLFNLGKAYIEQGKVDRALKTWELSLQLARKAKFHYLALDAIAEQTKVLRTLNRTQEAHKILDIAVQIAQGVKFKPGIARMYYLKGKLYEAEGRLELALGMYTEALRVAEETKGVIRKEDAYHHRAALSVADILLRQKESLDKVASYLVRALDYCFEYKHLPTMQKILDTFGRYFQTKGDLESAIKYTDMALKIARARLDYKEMARLSYMLGYYYVLEGNTEHAEMYFTEGLSLALQCDWPQGVELAKRAIRRLQAKGVHTGSWKTPEEIS